MKSFHFNDDLLLIRSATECIQCCVVFYLTLSQTTARFHKKLLLLLLVACYCGQMSHEIKSHKSAHHHSYD